MAHPYRLMAPGPVQLAPEAKLALGEEMIHHRTPEFEKILQRVLIQLPVIFGTKQPVLILTSTGSGGMEAALVNCLSAGDEIISIVCGKFGERWAKMAQAYGLRVHTLNVPWGKSLQLSELENILKIYPQVKAVLTQACETSTATLLPVQQIAQTVRRLSPQALVMVDAITAIGATSLPMDEWDLDVVVAGSQKAFMIPTGLSFIALSNRAWQASKSALLPRFYFDLNKELDSNKKGETMFSSSVSLIKALDRVLPYFEGPRLEQQKQRCYLHAQITRELAERYLKMKVYSQAPSPSVTAVQVPEGMDGQKLREHLEMKYNITVMGGQDQLKGLILRIGHLGYVTSEDLLQTLIFIGKSLKDLGMDLAESQIVAMEQAGRRLFQRPTL